MTQSVKLVSEHIHSGIRYAAGQVVDMEDTDADWYRRAVIQQRQDVLESPVGKILTEVAAEVAEPVSSKWGR